MVVYIKEIEETCDIVKRVLVRLKRVLNVIKVEDNCANRMYYLPIFKDNKISKYRIKRLTNKINLLMEKDGATTVVLSENLDNNQLLKNYLYSNNINILNGRFLFKCLINKIIEYIFMIKNKSIELRRSNTIN